MPYNINQITPVCSTIDATTGMSEGEAWVSTSCDLCPVTSKTVMLIIRPLLHSVEAGELVKSLL